VLSLHNNDQINGAFSGLIGLTSMYWFSQPFGFGGHRPDLSFELFFWVYSKFSVGQC